MNEVDLWRSSFPDSNELVGIAETPSQGQIARLTTLFDAHPDVLKHQRDGRTRYDVIEEFSFSDTSADEVRHGSAFFLRKHGRRSKDTGVRCLVRYDDATTRQLMFEPGAGMVMDLDTFEATGAEDSELINTLLDSAESALRSQEPEQHDRKRKRIIRTIGARLCLTLVTAITSEVKSTYFGSDKEAIERTAFDKKNVRLQGTSATLTSSFPVNHVSTAEYNDIPKFRPGDSLTSRRRITINDPTSCVDTGAPATAGDQIAISDAYGSDDDVIASVNNGGSLSLCRLDTDSGGWEYVVQNFRQQAHSGTKTKPVMGPTNNNVAEKFYKSIPTYHQGDALGNPRRIKIDQPESCTNTTIDLSPTGVVNLSDVNGYKDDMIVVSNQGSAFSICRLDSNPEWWEVAVQILPRRTK